MPNQDFTSIEHYEKHLRTTISRWGPEQRVALAAAMAERWLPAYEAFSSVEEWGEPATLRRALDAVWSHARGQELSSRDRKRHSKDTDENTPHMDDFDAEEALAAAAMVKYALNSCDGKKNIDDTVMGVLSGFEAVAPGSLSDDPDVEPVFWGWPVVRTELEKQLQLVEQVGAMPRVDGASIDALRSRLKSPEYVGEAPPRRKAPGITNQTLFEEYRREMEREIKNAVQFTSSLVPSSIMTVQRWLTRYSRRRTTIERGTSLRGDVTAFKALMARALSRDAIDTKVPEWDPDARYAVENTYQHMSGLGMLDAKAADRPHAYGPSLRRLFVEATRRGASYDGAWKAVAAWSDHRPSAWDAEDQRRKTGGHMAIQTHLAREVTWQEGRDLDYPWMAQVDGATWRVRLNDFPDEILYTLLIDDAVVGDFNDWPAAWRREEVNS